MHISKPSELRQYPNNEQLVRANKDTMSRIVPSTVPAKLVFPEQTLQAYNDWMQCQNPSGVVILDKVRIPDHEEFFQFGKWQQQDNQVDCPKDHPRHPASATRFPDLCPICTMQVYTRYLKLMTNAWALMNGGRGTVQERSNREYQQVKAAWYYAKKEFTNADFRMEKSMQQELEWEEQHPDTDTSATFSASKAMGMAMMMDSFPHSDDQEASTVSEKKRPRKQKSVHFAPDVVFNDEIARPKSRFSRKSPVYRPGRHACPSADGWQNNSYATSMRVTLMQLKVFLTFDESDLDTNKVNHRDCQGLLANHELCNIVLHEIKGFMKTESLEYRRDFKSLVNNSDAILILNPKKTQSHEEITYGFEDLMVFCVPEEEEEEPYNVPLPDDAEPMDVDEPTVESPRVTLDVCPLKTHLDVPSTLADLLKRTDSLRRERRIEFERRKK
ncbi:hypothetical protein BDV96DRAFT_658896 [Lophiotrema nucula]|uniref:Uncharacterized protein n=1 Tax=Lophiotrema nucula TaxID=690887 RepID=A0A6A5Z9Q4_9PLEO|nr:hypothetical protein BDV96DRAFT_658896 [Lophiotrema nucula]